MIRSPASGIPIVAAGSSPTRPSTGARPVGELTEKSTNHPGTKGWLVPEKFSPTRRVTGTSLPGAGWKASGSIQKSWAAPDVAHSARRAATGNRRVRVEKHAGIGLVSHIARRA